MPGDSEELPFESPDQVLALGAPRWDHMEACVADIPEGMRLADVGPKAFLPLLKEWGSNLNVVSKEEITLKDATKAYRTESNGYSSTEEIGTQVSSFRRVRMTNGSPLAQPRREIHLRLLGSLRV